MIEDDYVKEAKRKGIDIIKVNSAYVEIKKTINEQINKQKGLNPKEMMLLLSRVAHEAVNSINVMHGSMHGKSWGTIVEE